MKEVKGKKVENIWVFLMHVTPHIVDSIIFPNIKL